MRNLKKFLSVLLVVAMLAMAMVPAFAETTISADAKACADIGMLVGQGNGVTAEYTATDLTRVQTAVLLLRLKGLEAAAKNYTGTANFADVAATEWFAPYTAYLKANPALGFIGDGTNFMAGDKISAQQYYKVVLTALGYVVGTDFAYENTVAFAKSLGLDAVDGAKAVLTVDDLAKITVDGLKLAVKGGTATLAETLVAAGKIDAVKAEAAGLYSSAAAIVSAKATGEKSILVTFNKAVDTTKAAIAVKKGSISINVASKTFAADAKSVTLETSGALTEGDYTVSVSGLTTTALSATVTVEDEYVAKIEFNSTNAVLERLAADDDYANVVTASVTLYNQYGEDVTEDYYTTDMSYTSSKGDIVADEDGMLTITEDADYDFETGDKISVTILNSESGAFASTMLTVVDEAQASSIVITSLYNEDEDEELDVEDADYSSFWLVFEVKDQYGRNIVDTLSDTNAVTVAEEDIILTSSDEDVVIADTEEGAEWAVEEVDGNDALVLKLQKPADADAESGKATVTAVSKFSGKLAKFDVEVKDKVLVDSFTMVGPDVAVAGEDVEIKVTAIDYYGDAITDASDIKDGLDDYDVSGNSEIDRDTDISFEKDYVTGDIKMVINTSGVDEEDTIIVSAVTDSGKLVQLTINLKDPAEVAVVTGLDSDDVKTKIFLNDTVTMNYETIFANDNYDREVDTDDMFSLNGVSYRYVVESDDTDVVAIDGANVAEVLDANDEVIENAYAITSDISEISFTAVDTGSSKITVTVQELDGANWVDVDGSDYSFTMTVVENDDISSYKVNAIAKLYDPWARETSINGVPAQTNTAYKNNADYAQEVEVIGVLSNGSEVAVPFGSELYTVTVTKGGIAVKDGTFLWVQDTGVADGIATSLKHDGDEESTSNAIVTIEGKDGAVVITAPYTVSNVAPKIATVTLEDGEYVNVESDTTVSVDLADFNTGYNADAVALNLTNNTARVAALVADVLTSEDQYGVEFENESAKYSIVSTNFVDENGDSVSKDAARASGDEFTVTAITGSIVKTFKVVIN